MRIKIAPQKSNRYITRPLHNGLGHHPSCKLIIREALLFYHPQQSPRPRPQGRPTLLRAINLEIKATNALLLYLVSKLFLNHPKHQTAIFIYTPPSQPSSQKITQALIVALRQLDIARLPMRLCERYRHRATPRGLPHVQRCVIAFSELSQGLPDGSAVGPHHHHWVA